MPPFEDPVLDIAVDVVSKIDGDAALRSLWAAVTKCKDSLSQGHRLENISWRLWYREMALMNPVNNLKSPFSARIASPLPPLSSCSGSEGSDSDLWESDSNISDVAQSQQPAASRSPSLARSGYSNQTRSTTQGRKRVAPLSASQPSPASARHPVDSQRANSAPCANGRRNNKEKSRPNVGLLISSLLPQKLDIHEIAKFRDEATRSVEDHPKEATMKPSAIPEPIVTAPTTPPAASGFPSVVVVQPTPRTSRPVSPVLPTTAHTLSPESAVLLPEPLSTSPPAETTESSKNTSPESPVSPPAGDGLDENNQLNTTKSHAKGKATARNHLPLNKLPYKHLASHKPHLARGHSKNSSTTSIPSRAASRPPVTRKNTGKSQRSPSPAGAPPKQTSPPKPSSNKASSATKKRNPSPKIPATTTTTTVTENSKRRGVEVVTSSDFETTDDDDDSWASESEEVETGHIAREAAEEAARQLDMFAKLPQRSYSNINLGRPKSGLLTHLFHPDPSIVPLGHPYRTSLSVQDLMNHHGQTSVATTSTATAKMHHPMPSVLGLSKSPVAGPVAAVFNVSALDVQGHATRAAALAAARQPPAAAGKGKTAMKPPMTGYVRKGRPQGVEVESESEEDPHDKVELSQSVAQARLAALADPNRRRAARQLQMTTPAPPPSPALVETVYTPSAPIALPHPYNLPAPSLPQTPRTLRRQMLTREMSESLRRNLLWERKVSKQVPRRQVGLLRPLTGSDGEQAPEPGPSHRILPRLTVMRTKSESQRVPHHGQAAPTEDATEMERRARIMRNRSFAGDYHAHGW